MLYKLYKLFGLVLAGVAAVYALPLIGHVFHALFHMVGTILSALTF